MKRLALGLVGVFVLTGCAASRSGSLPPPPSELPALADVVEAYNKPIMPLDRLWARAVVVATVETEDGPEKEQGDGHLQVVRGEDEVALSLGKLNEVHLFLACDAQRYWWLDLIDGDDKVALVGRHDLVTQERLEELGLPVQPLELIDLLCITPIDPAEARLGWSADHRRVALAAPGRVGVRVIELDARTLEPVGVRLLDAGGNVTVTAEFEGRQAVRVEGLALGVATVPERYHIEIPQRGTEIRLRLAEPENKRISPVNFDFDKLVARFRIDRVVNLDGAVARDSDR